MKLFRKTTNRAPKQREKGVALFIALVALLLLAAIATGMMFQANTESAINYNYRDAQFTYFASGAGLEDAREKMRKDSIFTPAYTPQGAPRAGNPLGIIYIVNPTGGETVAPWDSSNLYFDTELCHEYSAELGLTDPGPNVPCGAGAPAGSYTSLPSDIVVNGSALAGSNSALTYKWVRVALKFNHTLEPQGTTTGFPVDPSRGRVGPPDTLVCWNNSDGFESMIAGERIHTAPAQQPSAFELAALQQAIDTGLGTPAVFMFGGKGKSTSTSGTTTGTTTSSTTGTTSGTTTGTTSGTTTGTTSGTTTGTTTATTSGTTTGTTSGSTTGTTTAGTTTGTSSGTTTGTARPGYYRNIDACNANNEKRYSVYLITSLAVSRRGARRMAQYEVSRSSFPQIPGGLTFNGPGATFSPPDSQNFNIDGNDHATANGTTCAGAGGPVHAITGFNDTEKTRITNDITTGGRPTHYTGLGGTTPDVVDGSIPDPLVNPPTAPLAGLTTVKENEDLVSGLVQSADLISGSVGNINQLPVRNPACASWPLGARDSDSAPQECKGPKITVIQGDADLRNPSGSGILLVTGNLTLGGNFSFDGLVLVIGKVKLTLAGGGQENINGGVYVARTRNDDGSLRTDLGSPYVNANGGGNSNLYYDSCKIANAAANQSFRVITYREMTY